MLGRRDRRGLCTEQAWGESHRNAASVELRGIVSEVPFRVPQLFKLISVMNNSSLKYENSKYFIKILNRNQKSCWRQRKLSFFYSSLPFFLLPPLLFILRSWRVLVWAEGSRDARPSQRCQGLEIPPYLLTAGFWIFLHRLPCECNDSDNITCIPSPETFVDLVNSRGREVS